MPVTDRAFGAWARLVVFREGFRVCAHPEFFASGRWTGSNPAEVGCSDVEIEVPECVTGWTAGSAGVAPLSQAGADSGTLITGRVVGFGDGDDAVVEVRVGSDILLLEIPNRRSELPAVEGWISFRASQIQLYPHDL
ncbi:hypothetical protein AAG656_06350 [Streptomyces albidoflavus]|uniref:hypothetical protein n=1 Tax=Streptomyces TaxID=1883 RepID=UPI001A41108F|nr:hypothetical protein [Streptomyces sp. T7(2022)]MBL0803242.1 hypothetical protein [Streptomyces albidoflavus]MCG5119022.1 hypothetical protein [Streptomyces sp. T7(2022)]